jgi:hypothetical protein
LAYEYDVKVVISLLMVCFDCLNPITNASTTIAFDVTRPNFKENMLGKGLQLKNLFEY